VTSFVVPNLVATTPYTVRVAAFNAQGYSPFAAAAPALGTWAEVQTLVVTANGNGGQYPQPQPFSLRFQDQGGAYSAGSSLVPVYGSAAQVQDVLQRLGAPGVRAVLVSKEDLSDYNYYDLTGASITHGILGWYPRCALIRHSCALGPPSPCPPPPLQCTPAARGSTGCPTRSPSWTRATASTSSRSSAATKVTHTALTQCPRRRHHQPCL
jgi:hypothetical protein